MANNFTRIASSPATGAVGTLIGVIIATFGYVGPPPASVVTSISVTSDQWRWLAIGLAVAILSAAQAFWALHKQKSDLARELRACQVALTQRKTNQALADLLMELYTEGLHQVLHAPIDSDAEFQHWQQGENRWTGKVMTVLEQRNCSKQEIGHFRDLHEVPMTVFHHPEQVRQHQKSMLSLRLNRLKRIIDRYSENPVLTI